jgi:hypothetical protein
MEEVKKQGKESLFVPYEIALELKKLLFDEPCFGKFIKSKFQYNSLGDPKNYNNESYGVNIISAPTFSQAFRFFREKYNLYAELYTANMGAIEYCFQIRDLYSEKYIYDNFQGAGSSYVGTFNTPEEAELACLDKLIEIVKSK